VMALLFGRLAAADPAIDTDQHWQVLARADIEAVHATIERSHPGAIDSLNPGHARAAGQQWYEQWEGPKEGYRLDRDEIIRRHGKLRRFSGKVVLVTDTQCASACLDFADLIRLVPGAVHVGKTHG